MASSLFKLPLFGSSKTDLLKTLTSRFENSRRTTYIVTPNPEQFVLAWRDSNFLKTLKTADFLLPDGVGLVWASRILSGVGGMPSITQRISGVEVVESIIEETLRRHGSILIIGGRDYHGRWLKLGQQKVAIEAPAIYWSAAYKNAQTPTAAEETAVAELIKQTKPMVVLVALGAPTQEFWLDRHRQLLEQAGVKIAMVCGGAIDVLTEKLPRAPRIVQNIGLEWLFRLYQEPWRWRRQLRLIIFMVLVGKTFVESLWTKVWR